MSTEFSIPNIGKVSTDKSIKDKNDENVTTSNNKDSKKIDEKVYYLMLLGLLICAIVAKIIFEKKKGTSK